MMNKYALSCFLISFLIISGCNQEGGMDKKDIEEMATNVAIEYMLVEEDIDLIVTDVQITNDNVGVAFVHGHMKNDKNEEFSVMVNYLNDFEVEGYGSGELEEDEQEK